MGRLSRPPSAASYTGRAAFRNLARLRRILPCPVPLGDTHTVPPSAAPEVTNLGVSAAVLTVSAVVESYSLLVATRAVAAGAAAAGLSFSE